MTGYAILLITIVVFTTSIFRGRLEYEHFYFPHLLVLKLVKIDVGLRSLLRNKLVFEQWLAEFAHRLQRWPLLRLLLALGSLRPGASSWEIVLVLGRLDGSRFFHPR